MKLKAKAKIWKTGSGSYVVTIPKDYVTNEMLHEGEEVNLEIDVAETPSTLILSSAKQSEAWA